MIQPLSLKIIPVDVNINRDYFCIGFLVKGALTYIKR